jgi:hypothetical protein
MGIWQHMHTVTTTKISPDLGKFAEILDDVSVEILNSCGWGYGSTFIPLPPKRFPQIWESLLIS